MALIATSEQHQLQINAGTEGRLQGHKFEELVTDELNNIDYTVGDIVIESVRPNVYIGNPAEALIKHISNDKKKAISRLKAYWLGGLATANEGAEILNENGEKITGSKSDILMDVVFEDGTTEKIGVSAKACSNNAQMALTTCSVFCEMLRDNGIDVSEDAETGLKMFCGEDGFRPLDNYVPKDSSNIPSNRTARPERWYWEEMSSTAQDEWKAILTKYQIEITKMLLQCARTYKTDSYKPTYILHECKRHTSIKECEVAVMSVEEFASYSKKFDSFGIKEQPVRKGSYKGVDLAIHQYPHFGFIQFQPIGNKQNFSELQFNLKAKYYNAFKKLIEKNDDK